MRKAKVWESILIENVDSYYKIKKNDSRIGGYRIEKGEHPVIVISNIELKEIRIFVIGVLARYGYTETQVDSFLIDGFINKDQ
jgi:hypothetical protein